jgi:hypothetical protein
VVWAHPLRDPLRDARPDTELTAILGMPISPFGAPHGFPFSVALSILRRPNCLAFAFGCTMPAGRALQPSPLELGECTHGLEHRLAG